MYYISYLLGIYFLYYVRREGRRVRIGLGFILFIMRGGREEEEKRIGLDRIGNGFIGNENQLKLWGREHKVNFQVRRK
jgi:hypothetical protein